MNAPIALVSRYSRRVHRYAFGTDHALSLVVQVDIKIVGRGSTRLAVTGAIRIDLAHDGDTEIGPSLNAGGKSLAI